MQEMNKHSYRTHGTSNPKPVPRFMCFPVTTDVALFMSLHRKDDTAEEDKSLEICPIVGPVLHFFNPTAFLS